MKFLQKVSKERWYAWLSTNLTKTLILILIFLPKSHDKRRTFNPQKMQEKNLLKILRFEKYEHLNS